MITFRIAFVVALGKNKTFQGVKHSILRLGLLGT